VTSERRSNGRINDQRRCLGSQIEPSGPDDPTQGLKAVGLIRWTNDVSNWFETQRLPWKPVGSDDPAPMSRQGRIIRRLRRKSGNGSKRLLRLGGLYKRLTPAIFKLVEFRETLYTLKNTSKPTQVLSYQILSTPLRVLVLD